MKLVAAVLLGVFATFTLTIAFEAGVINFLFAKGVWLPFAELAVGGPLVALIVGSLIGLIAKERARVAAVLGFAPWITWLVIEVGFGHWSRWPIVVVISALYLAVGIGVAGLVGGRTTRSAILSSR
jgi:hypothetical protein